MQGKATLALDIVHWDIVQQHFQQQTMQNEPFGTSHAEPGGYAPEGGGGGSKAASSGTAFANCQPLIPDRHT